MKRGKREKIRLELVRNYRARGFSWQQIADEMGYSKSAVWRAFSQPGRGEAEVPAGKRRTTYLTDDRWSLLHAWARQMTVSRARVIAWLIDEEVHRRRASPDEGGRDEGA